MPRSLRHRAGVDYFELLVREILNRSEAKNMPFDWTINPYRGCEFGCVYCYARYTHGFFDTARAEDFESKIYVKTQRRRTASAAAEARATCAASGSRSAPPPIRTRAPSASSA